MRGGGWADMKERMLKDNVMLITDAACGIGRAMALAGAREGAGPVRSDRAADAGLDVACHNAGIGGVPAPAADYPPDAGREETGIHLSGVFYGMKYQIAARLPSGGGSTVDGASILGAAGLTNAAADTAAKHGVVGLTQATVAGTFDPVDGSDLARGLPCPVHRSFSFFHHGEPP